MIVQNTFCVLHLYFPVVIPRDPASPWPVSMSPELGTPAWIPLSYVVSPGTLHYFCFAAVVRSVDILKNVLFSDETEAEFRKRYDKMLKAGDNQVHKFEKLLAVDVPDLERMSKAALQKMKSSTSVSGDKSLE